MNICFVSTDFPAPSHPAYVFVEQLVNEMVRQGVNVSVIAPQSITRHLVKGDKLLPKETIVNIGNKSYHVYRPYHLSLGNCPDWLQNILEKFRYRSIRKVITSKKIKIDVLYGHFWHNAYVVRKFAYHHNIPLFVACGEGDNAIEILLRGMSEKEKARFVNAVSGIVSVSSLNKRRCIEYGLSDGTNIIVLPNAVDTELFSKAQSSNKRKLLGVKDDDFLVAFTGAFIHRKGSQRLAAAMKKLQDKSVKVMFIGKGRPGDDATPECDGIVLRQPIDHSEIPSYLKAADVFCLPTLNEGCSNAIVEALASGLPVISSNLPFNEDILDKTNSILIDPMNIDEIATSIEKIKKDKQLKRNLSIGALRTAEKLNIGYRASKILEFIQSKTNIS